MVLPDDLLDSDERLRMVLTHELVHLKQFDDWINLFCRIIGSFLFFHPLFHVAVRELELAGEEVCDGWVIRLTRTKEAYANCLVEFARIGVGRLPIGFSERKSSLVRRVKSLFNDEEVFRMIGKKQLIFLSIRKRDNEWRISRWEDKPFRSDEL